MTYPRLIQNFKRCRGLLWASGTFQAEALERTLLRLGLTLARIEETRDCELDPDRDVLFLDADQAIDAVALVRPGATLPDAPVIGLVGVEAPSRLKLLAEAGATATLRKPVNGAMVYSALFLGVNTYRRLRSAETRLALGERKHRARRLLIKAVVALMQARGLGDDEAYAELRRESMRRRLNLEDFCEALLAPDSPFPTTWPNGPASTTQAYDKGEHIDAKDADAGGRDGGALAADRGAGDRPDQARRA